jgi:hypothetical protein
MTEPKDEIDRLTRIHTIAMAVCAAVVVGCFIAGFFW